MSSVKLVGVLILMAAVGASASLLEHFEEIENTLHALSRDMRSRSEILTRMQYTFDELLLNLSEDSAFATDAPATTKQPEPIFNVDISGVLPEVRITTVAPTTEKGETLIEVVPVSTTFPEITEPELEVEHGSGSGEGSGYDWYYGDQEY